MTFYDRRDELTTLRSAFQSDEHELFVVYGRRRVGKTELLTEFASDRPHIYFLASQEAETRQREKFVSQIAATFDERVPRIETWDDALAYLGEKVADQKLLVIIDEFPYLVAENDSLPSYVQAFVDHQLAESDSMLVLCGSSVSTMESEVLGHESPLFGRRTGQIDLQPFSFSQSTEIISYPIEDAIRSFSITGGTPLYLTQFDYGQSLRENVLSNILSPTAPLFNEPEFLLRTELRNPARYMSILEAIATGHTTPKEIAGSAGIDSGPLSKYLQTLKRLRFIDRDVPVTASPKQSKRSRYRIGDGFLRFWFRFVEPNRSGIEEAPAVVFEEAIEPAMPEFVSWAFEDIARELLWAAIRTGELNQYAEIGPWWYGGEEIDLVGLAPGSERILFTEVKWTTDPVGMDLVESLRGKTDAVRWGPDTRTESFALVSKSGFEDGLARTLPDNWTLFDLSDVERLLA
ncbi:putative ATPase (AAA+ superfamily) [Halodesulfurarchaeum formicicum]|uniref:Putative ATPase (AAA+ superfamily) n=1 Tax=Halodesulfurarchaeum formicicum TaxID=1873524 RepID=A0A1D8S3U4_9EURY|nr:ATP-binding protein [Halodesulfurarchaeum formicicum]AOW80029.1 putative ATPase (AAA+ superfamily) [Halodesulfurarchaeum formicicum]